MFRPPCCPHAGCPAHRDPPPGFCVKNGSYRVKVRGRRVPRFRCRVCRRSFSRQTFRADRYDHRPQLNVALLELLAGGSSLRGAARELGLSRRCTELKARKLLGHLAALEQNLAAGAGASPPPGLPGPPGRPRVPAPRELAHRMRAGQPRARASLEAVVSWRQDWGRRSLHPLTRASESIEAFDRRRRRPSGAAEACGASSP